MPSFLLHIYFAFTDNNDMTGALVAVFSALFAIMICPIYIYNYIYINTGQQYASLNVGVYGKNIFNANTVKNHPEKMQINGKDKQIDAKKFRVSTFYKIFNQICLYKVIQLGDYGLQKNANAYIVLAQNSLTTAAYKFIQINGNYCKLRNYTVLNQEHSDIRYYAKAVTVINAFVVLKILLILLTEKINGKIKKKQGK